MKIATLQFAPKLGAVNDNIQHANALLQAAELPANLDLLVLPEMAFSGYNFPNLAAITPFLEPTSVGPTTTWAIATARRLQCHVIVGYPERSTPDNSAADGDDGSKNYNATATVSPTGEILHTYRKTFLYYTDATWASTLYNPPSPSESPSDPSTTPTSPAQPPFLIAPDFHLGALGHGICMDINPHNFTAPWTAYEFANAMVASDARLVVLSMAWLTRLEAADVEAAAAVPDMDTVAYWLERFLPLLRDGKERVVVFANRCGSESGEGGVIGGVDVGERVTYAGSSCVMRFNRGGVEVFERVTGGPGVLGKGEEGLLTVDTSAEARFLLKPG